MNFNKKSMMFYFVFWGILLFILIGFFWILLKGVRILDYRAAMAAFEILPDYSDFVRFDPAREGGHLLPNINTVALGSRHGEIIRWITNSKGFRNDQEFDYFPSPGTFRILLLGDSFVDGMRTDQKSTIGAVLEKSLNASTRTDQYKHYEVMIAGHNNPALAWYYYQEYGAKYHPHLVILGVTLANDLTWQHYKIRVFPTIDADGLLFLQFAAEQEKISVSLDLPLPQEAYTPKHALREALQNMELRFRQYLARKSLYLFGYLVPPNLMKNDKTRQIPGRRELSAKDFGLSP